MTGEFNGRRGVGWGGEVGMLFSHYMYIAWSICGILFNYMSVIGLGKKLNIS